MESRIAERLRNHSLRRTNLVSVLLTKLPPSCIENNHIVHAVLLLTTVLIIIGIFSTTRSLTLFSFHPVCMAIGSLLFLGEGIVAFRNTFLLDALSPIMQHDKTTKVRTLHQTVQCLGAVFLCFGLLFILAHKVGQRKTIIPQTIHAWLGVLCIVLVVVQVVVGFLKVSQPLTARRRRFRWHGHLGLLLWDALCLTIFVGLASFLPASLFALAVLLLPGAAWLMVMAQVQTKTGHRDEDAFESADNDAPEAADALVSAEAGEGRGDEGFAEDTVSSSEGVAVLSSNKE